MILTDGKTTLDYFDRIPTDIPRIGLSLSGGLDSALILYCLAKTLHDRGQTETEIFTYHNKWLRYKKLNSLEAATNVLEYVRKKFPDITIHDPLVAVMSERRTNKFFHSIVQILKIRFKYKIRWWIVGLNLTDYQNLDFKDYFHRFVERMLTHILPNSHPFGWVDKKFIAAQYHNLDIMDLSMITNSCTADNPGGMPCKTCHWCKSRHEAFGCYDYGFK